MKDFVKVMKALSDPNRIRIIKLLQHKVMCVCELQAVLGIAQPTVSKHLKVLEEADLVYFKKMGCGSIIISEMEKAVLMRPPFWETSDTGWKMTRKFPRWLKNFLFIIGRIFVKNNFFCFEYIAIFTYSHIINL